jgi:AcrR family transcriptional regulator
MNITSTALEPGSPPALEHPAHRLTAVDRREAIVQAAMEAFADKGLHGTSTETIARNVGISQPYLFRLYGTKKELFLASIRRCFDDTLESFRVAVEEGSPDMPVEHRLGAAYAEMLRDGTKLRMQMQSYAACDDPDIRAAVQAGFGDVTEYVSAVVQVEPASLATFMGRGMLLNVMASMDVLEATDGWAAMLREGCMAEVE